MTIDIEEAKQVHAELAALHKEGWCACQSSTLPARVEATLGDIIAALSTPPAEDVREAAGRLSSHAWHGETYGRPTTVVEVSDLRLVLNALTAEVRPRGTVTDAEHREAVHRAVRAGIESAIRGTADRDLVRAVATHVLALEARS